ncbi:MAG TPA: hypothetical protein VGC76_19200 [Pyrinomonadaceae bacterium]|jgi:hypothetical protein
MRDKIKNLLTQTDRDEIDNHISQIEAILSGKLVALDEKERVKYGRINEKNKLLVNKVRDYHQHSPNTSSPDVDWGEFESDYRARQFLETRSNHLSSLASRMKSTKILHDSDNFEDSLKDYNYSKYKKGSGADGFDQKVADLRQFFNRTGIKK